MNAAKVLTILCLIGCSLVFGVSDLRQVIYLCLHVSYCLWWLLEQWFYPQRRRMFSEPISFVEVSFTLLFVGIFYALPGYLAFINPLPLSLTTAAVALPLYILGSLINASADVEKITAKQSGVDLVKEGLWRFSRNVNYFGDLLRYLSLSVSAGRLGPIWCRERSPCSISRESAQAVRSNALNLIDSLEAAALCYRPNFFTILFGPL